MDKNTFTVEKADIAWCPGCGNFPILDTLQSVLAELSIEPANLVLVSGIGQAAKMPQYIKSHYFNGLHGRALPVATGVKASNPSLTVITESGDGCTYGEGGNHFIHTIRRNPDITHLVHNNMVYGLTKGQASPTSEKGFRTPVQVDGSFATPFNPLAVAIALNASFVARAFAGDKEQTKEIVKKAVLHKGYALVDILQPCVTFNKINTYAWFKQHTYYIEDGYDPANRTEAFIKATQEDKLPLGVLYRNTGNAPFEENLSAYKNNKEALYLRTIDRPTLASVIASLRA